MKWDIIKSVLKSVAGLQGRKFKVQHNQRGYFITKICHVHALQLIAQVATFVCCFGVVCCSLLLLHSMKAVVGEAAHLNRAA